MPTTETPAELERLTALLDGYRADFNEAIRLASAPKSATAAFVCDSLIKRARAGLRAIDRTLERPLLGSPYGSLGEWGPNGYGPKVADLLASARFHSRYGAAVTRVAA